MFSSFDLAAFLAYVNDVLQAIIVIFGVAVVLYNLPRLPRGAVIRSFSATIAFVVLVYLTELLVSRTIRPDAAELFLRLGWIGVAMVPAAQFHLSDALLTTTGKASARRRRLVAVGYLSGLLFVLLGLFSDLVVAPPLATATTPRLTAGPYFFAFAVYYWVVAASSVYNVWRARSRCLTRTTRQRMTTTLLAILAAPLAVFPYTLLARDPAQEVPIPLWFVIILGNLVVSLLFGVLTSQLVYFGAVSPDRVVRVRLYKFMARVPMTATILLLVYALVARAPSVFGLPKEVALGVAAVATVMIVEWMIHAFKRPLERTFQLNDDPDVRRIQLLSERLLTTSDLQQFLESVLAATCEAFRTPTSFVASLNATGPHLEAVVGPLGQVGQLPAATDLQQLTRVNGSTVVGDDEVTEVGEFFIWEDYWIQPLYSSATNSMLGVFGMHARSESPDFSEEELILLTRLKAQAASALEDRVLQQEVFAAVEGLLPGIISLQQTRSAATFGGLPVLVSDKSAVTEAILQDPEFSSMVRDALTHYWGGPKLTESPLLNLNVVQRELDEHDNNQVNALRAILIEAIEQQRPDGQRNLTTAEWILYNILDLKFIQGKRVRDVARRLAMSESDLYRKQRVAIENVARSVAVMEMATLEEDSDSPEPTAGDEIVSDPVPG